MPTRLFLRYETFPLSGTFPTGETDSQVADFTVSGANTLRMMYGTKGTTLAGNYGASAGLASQQHGFMGFWTSPPLASGLTIGGGGETLTINVADFQYNTTANFCVNRCHAYVWRPSTGTAVGDLCTVATTPTGGSPTEPTASQSVQVTTFSVPLSAVVASAGDVVIVELWSEFTPDNTLPWDVAVYYNGGTENTVENTVVADHAAFAEFSQTLTFTLPEARLTQQSALVFGEVDTLPQARLTQQSALVFGEVDTLPQARLTQQSVIVWHSGTADLAHARISTLNSEVLAMDADSPARVSTLDAEVLSLDTASPARVSSISVEALAVDNNAPARVSSLAVEVLTAFLPVSARISTMVAEVLCSNDDITKRPRVFITT